MKFKYKARTKEGEIQAGYVEAATREAAATILASHNVYIVTLEGVEAEHWYDRVRSYFEGVGRKDRMLFIRQLATLLEAHLPLGEALETLEKQVSHPTLKEAVAQIGEDINAGLAFSQAMARRNDIFSEFAISMVRSAEVTGNLNEIMAFLADYEEKEYALIAKLRAAMIYPAVVITIFVAVALLIITFVMPQLQPIFEESGVELPFATRVFVGSGNFIAKWWPLLLVAIVGGIASLISYARTPEGKALFDDAKVKLPIVGKVYIPITTARFAYAASALIKGGVPVAQTLEIVSHTVGNVLYQDLLHEASEAVREGEPLSQALAKHPDYFPSLVPQMIVVGEATAQLEVVFQRIAQFYTREADNITNSLTDLIQPALMLAIGGLVGLLFSSIIIPIYKLTTTLGGQ